MVLLFHLNVLNAGWGNESCTEKSNSILDAYQCENAIIDFGNSGGGEGGEDGVSRYLECEGKPLCEFLLFLQPSNLLQLNNFSFL